VRLSDDRERLHEHVDAACFAGAARPQHHDPVTDPLRLVQLGPI
jgi:hypothetical protein